MIVKLFLQDKFNRYFSSARAGVWLIVVPAVVIVIIYFLGAYNETVIKKERSSMIDNEKRYAVLKKDLPGHAFVNFISNQDASREYFAARYALIPARLVRGLEPRHDYLLVRVSDLSERPCFIGYRLKKDYGNGVMLFSRGVD